MYFYDRKGQCKRPRKSVIKFATMSTNLIQALIYYSIIFGLAPFLITDLAPCSSNTLAEP